MDVTRQAAGAAQKMFSFHPDREKLFFRSSHVPDIIIVELCFTIYLLLTFCVSPGDGQSFLVSGEALESWTVLPQSPMRITGPTDLT